MAVTNTNAQKDSKSWLVGGTLYAYDLNSSDVQSSRARSLGFCDGVDLTSEVSKVSLYASNFGPRAKVRENVIEQNVNISIILRDTQPENVAMALFGSTSDQVAEVAKSETALAYTNGILILDSLIDSLGTAPVLTDTATGLVTYELGATKNYVLNEGSIWINEDQSGATTPIVDGESIDVVYDTIATTTIEGFEDSSKTVGLYFEGENISENGELVKVEIYKVSLDPTDNYSILSSEDYVTLTINGSVLASNNSKGNSKYYREVRQS